MLSRSVSLECDMLHGRLEGAMDFRKDSSEPDLEELSAIVVDAAFHLHRDLGPGLLESVYQTVFAQVLERRGLRVQRQQVVSFEFDGIRFDEGLKVDLLVEGRLVVELKSVEALSWVHKKQLLTYLRLLQLPLGLVINFGSGTFREAVKRVVNGHSELEGSRLGVNQQALVGD
jgi:iron complex transport system substrate-binding protein